MVFKKKKEGGKIKTSGWAILGTGPVMLTSHVCPIFRSGCAIGRGRRDRKNGGVKTTTAAKNGTGLEGIRNCNDSHTHMFG
nr:uncharacterized protein CTRU02_00908 [Colletotrichum truncatum]KAF6800503.1 hypothetical protein CTRU02_00908 [Colletotrichum truncatum]